MSDAVVTRLDRPYAQQPETRAAAQRRIAREPDADMLLAAFGLADDEPPPSPTCPVCGRPLRKDKLGGHKPCPRQLCGGEPS
jgi:hypothetical protein